MEKIIAVVPVFNEEKTLRDILGRIRRQTDLLVCVNDGSTDASMRILREEMGKSGKGYVVDLPRNLGMAGALRRGFEFVLYLRDKKVVRDGDWVVTIDADGQHEPEYIRPLVRYAGRRRLEVLLTRRDFSVYPIYKRLGNRFLTWTNSRLAGFPYRDVESGLRLLRVGVLERILAYYTGVQYSCAQEIALISAREGCRIDNDYLVRIAYYRPGTTVWDGFIVLALSLYAYGRWKLKLRNRPQADRALMAKAFRAFRRKPKD
ncbi:MAG TPA: glycosyltransferase family 2 protein [bacterium]|nr:glycosyltransferase family 2 protein [bacterium]